jgi:hypothetical protein
MEVFMSQSRKVEKVVREAADKFLREHGFTVNGEKRETVDLRQQRFDRRLITIPQGGQSRWR